MTAERKKEKPPLDLYTPKETKTATLAMGCFWSPDALFGSLEGVARTRGGYAGGTTENPTYWHLADHIETIQLDYDPARISFQDLLYVFFKSHKPYKEPWKRQYMSAVFYHDEEQEKLIHEAKESIAGQVKNDIHTAVYPLQRFYLAENRHQKYKLQRQPELMAEFSAMYPEFPDFINSTAAARVNGYLYGYGNKNELMANIGGFGLSPAGQKVLHEKALKLKEVYHCSG